MKRKVVIMLVFVVVCGLSGCGKTASTNQYNTSEIYYISYTDIDTVCDSRELTEAGADFLSSLEEQILLSFMIDSSIEITEELGDYDHLILTNPQWVERFGDSSKLKPVEYDSLSNSMREFLNDQVPIWTVDGSILSDGMGLYQYEDGKLLAFPVNVTLGAAKPVEAKKPLIILVDAPAQMLNAGSCMLPLSSSGNVMFSDGNELQKAFEESPLKEYGTVHEFSGVN